jgi:colanic acid/amylovoran biosynthesis protein
MTGELSLDSNLGTQNSIRVALLWHAFGHDNLGVDALSRANAEIIESAATKQGLEVEFVTLGSGQKAEVAELPRNVKVGPSPSIRQLVKGRSQFLKVLRSCDLAVDIGEGDSFTDIYGRRRFGFHCATKLASILLGHPLVLSPQTIGPFEHPLHRWIATRLINRASAVYARDNLSMAFLDELGTRSARDEFIDVAFRLPFSQVPRTEDRIRVGINVSGLLYNGGYTGRNELGMALDYAALTDTLIAHFLNEPDVEVHVFSHVAGSGGPDDDAPVIAKLAKKFPDIMAAPLFTSSIAAKSWISGLDFVIAGRMHACIGAYSAGVPVVPIAYSRKFNGLFGTLNYPYFIDGKATTNEKAVAEIVGWFRDRATLKAAIEMSRSIIDERLQRYEDSIGQILASIVSGRG